MVVREEASRYDLHVGGAPRCQLRVQHVPHHRRDIDGDHPRTDLRDRQRELPGARAEVDDTGGTVQAVPLQEEHLVRSPGVLLRVIAPHVVSVEVLPAGAADLVQQPSRTGLARVVRPVGARPAQNGLDDRRLRREVVRSVFGEQRRGVVLHGGIPRHLGRLGAKVVPKVKVVATGLGILHHDIEVVVLPVGGGNECLPPGDPAVAFVHVAERTQPLDGPEHLVGRRHHDVDVDNRLRGEAGYGGASHMLDPCADAIQGRDDPAAQGLEQRRPGGVVRHDSASGIEHVGP